MQYSTDHMEVKRSYTGTREARVLHLRDLSSYIYLAILTSVRL